ncbi:heavy-metal-associated domain-containing protein [Oceanivirga miroungae]|uniref:Heavy metal transport/detoxification protein n=1 Tax=Oceanivirga miroungae TaxID=1130046 RepID=A0A6I8MAQ7_9FUSO|nr:heavy metal-associated domain-containing protein [Oceanivirga miroungae]VWL85863.1 heavy metal transport/detoxification protein [Oceanivirga miroungae]
MKSKILTIPAIKCNSCVEKITNVLYSFPEVEEISVDLDEKTVEVILSTDISDNELKGIIKSAGSYEVTEIK